MYLMFFLIIFTAHLSQKKYLVKIWLTCGIVKVLMWPTCGMSVDNIIAGSQWCM